jgi:enoyl-CoA hydratase/carnithine racemase
VHLRAATRRDVLDGLVAESALYSALQAGLEHRTWRSATPPRRRDGDDGPRVRIERDDGVLTVTLQRPQARNALDRRMRDELLEALAVAEADAVLRVVLRGEGSSFCAGGDLDEFGTAPDPATAHLVRLRRSVGAVLHRLASRTTVELHGSCAGSGIELAAFAGRVVAHPGTTLALPELRLGLVPGAGGTVSLPRRIGRHRTAWLALAGRTVDAETARAWGLVDEIVGAGGPAS